MTSGKGRYVTLKNENAGEKLQRSAVSQGYNHFVLYGRRFICYEEVLSKYRLVATCVYLTA